MVPGGSEIKNLPAMQETWLQSLGWEDPLREEMAIHLSILVWKMPWTEEPAGYSSWGCKESDTKEQLTLSLIRSNIQYISLSVTEIQG